MKKEKTTAQRIIDAVGEMRENSSEMRMWKNIPLAKECISLLHELTDEEESPLGKAMACHAITEQLSERDVPRLVLGILRYQLELLQRSDEKADYPNVADTQHDIKRLEDYIDTENVSAEEYRKRYDVHLKADPIERTPLWEENYYDVEQECDRLLGDTPRGMGFCFAYWSTLRSVLAKRGIEWRSPHQMNPRVMFD